MVDYAAIRADDAEFRAYQAVLAGADVAGLPLPEVKALFINAYNCLAIGRIVDNVGAPIDGIRELGAPPPLTRLSFCCTPLQLW